MYAKEKMMRSLLITAAIAATIPCGMAMAQSADQTTVQTTVIPAAPVNIVPPAPSSAPLVPSGPAAPAASGSGSIDSGLHFAPAQEIVETAPPAAQSYPLCTKTLQDSCKNPNPAKELPYYRPKN
jgi:hypothetical protein